MKTIQTEFFNDIINRLEKINKIGVGFPIGIGATIIVLMVCKYFNEQNINVCIDVNKKEFKGIYLRKSKYLDINTSDESKPITYIGFNDFNKGIYIREHYNNIYVFKIVD